MIVSDLVEYKRLTDQSILIISSFREPIDRSISHMFQSMDNRMFMSDIFEPETLDYEKCQIHLLRFLKTHHFHHPLEEIEPDFFINEQFDKQKKCLLVNWGRYRILVVC